MARDGQGGPARRFAAALLAASATAADTNSLPVTHGVIHMTRTRLSAGLGLVASLALAAFQWPGAAQQSVPAMIVHKSPTCDCCAKWVDHAKAAGFTPQVHDMP